MTVKLAVKQNNMRSRLIRLSNELGDSKLPPKASVPGISSSDLLGIKGSQST